MSASSPASRSTVGVDVAGYLRGTSGSARRRAAYVARAAGGRRAGARPRTVDRRCRSAQRDGAAAERARDFAELDARRASPRSTWCCVNAARAPAASRPSSGADGSRGATRSASWAWETDAIPASLGLGVRRSSTRSGCTRATSPRPARPRPRRARSSRAAAGRAPPPSRRRHRPRLGCRTASSFLFVFDFFSHARSARTRSASSRRSSARSSRARGRGSCSRRSTATTRPTGWRSCAAAASGRDDIVRRRPLRDRPAARALVDRSDCLRLAAPLRGLRADARRRRWRSASR